MLFDSSLRRELWRSFSGTLVVLLTVVLTTVVIRILGLATKGALAPTDVGLVLSYTLLGQLPVLLALALFIADVTVLSRLWRDSEMVVWQVSGARQTSFLRPLLRMALPVLALVALTSLVARPWSQNQIAILKSRFEQRSDVSRVSPGQFQVSADGRRVFFIDSHSHGVETGRNVFMVSSDADHEAVVVADQGQVVNDHGQKILVLQHGERTQTDLQTGRKGFTLFETARIRIGDNASQHDLPVDMRATPTLDLLLLNNSDAKGELVWRLGLVWAALNLVIVGLSVAAGSARRHSSLSLVYALLVFVIYFNLLNLSQAWVSHGRVIWWQTLVLLHSSLSIAAVTVVWWRDGGTWRKPAGSPAGKAIG